MRVRKVKSVVALAFLLLSLLDLPSQIASQMAIKPKRSKLMKDAILWITFRKNGIPITEDVIERDFYPKLSSHYAASKAFRAFVIAFEKGVFPRLTQGNGAPCDHKYTKLFKNPENGMVDWHSMKKFVFDSYKRRDDPTIKYCDYRQGLVCLPSGQCGCNPGATFSASEKRCVLDEGQVCAVPDLDQGRGVEGYENDQLSQLVFNLEKPESCKPGTLCRNIYEVLKCWNVNTPGVTTGLPTGQGGSLSKMDIGMECALGLINTQVKCITRPNRLDDEHEVGNAPGSYVCYRFAEPVDQFTRTGYCAHVLSPYQVFRLGTHDTRGKTHMVLWRRNFVMGFVNRRTVTLDAGKLKAYYRKYIKEVDKIIFTGGTEDKKDKLKRKAGESCNVAKTEALVPIWKYYAGLDAVPPAPTSPNDEASLNDNLDKLIALVNMNHGDFCKTFWNYLFPDYQNPDYMPATAFPPLVCVKNANAKGKDNDGLCEVDPNDDGSTKPFAEKVQRLSDYALEAFYAKENEESNPEYLQILKDNPDPECRPLEKWSPQTRSLDTLEDLSCPSGSFCWDNYEDDSIFDQDCNVKPGQQRKVCLDVNGKYGKCEGMMLDKDIMKEVEAMAVDKGALLGEGAKCDHEWEDLVRAGVKSGEWTGNKRQLLAKLIEGKVKGTGFLCERSRLLECSDQDVCSCVSGTNQRDVLVVDSGGEENLYKSDYCYMTSGQCSADGLQNFLTDLPLTQKEMELINNHYGSAGEGNCIEGNHCMFVDQGNQQCTMERTGKTGHDLKPGGGLGRFMPPEKDFAERPMLRKSIVGGLLTVILLIHQNGEI